MAKKRYLIYVGDDTDFDILIAEAGDYLHKLGYTVAQYPERDGMSNSAVTLAALRYVANCSNEPSDQK